MGTDNVTYYKYGEYTADGNTHTIDCGFKPKYIYICRAGNSAAGPIICKYDETESTTTCKVMKGNSTIFVSQSISGSNYWLTNVSDTGFTIGTVNTPSNVLVWYVCIG